MSNSVPNISIAGLWVDIYTKTGIDRSKAVLVQNLSAFYDVQIAISATTPTVDGFLIKPSLVWEVDANETGVWVKSRNSKPLDVSVQVK